MNRKLLNPFFILLNFGKLTGFYNSSYLTSLAEQALTSKLITVKLTVEKQDNLTLCASWCDALRSAEPCPMFLPKNV